MNLRQPASACPAPRSLRKKRERGIALVIVMVVIFVLAVLAGGFAYSMKIETRLARNTSYESDLEWVGRSGVEMARYILGLHLTIPVEGAYDSLDQKWAGGTSTNEIMQSLSLDDVQVGVGHFSVKIIDMERMYNINRANEQVLQTALDMIGVDPSNFSPLVDAIMDWRDPDWDPRLNGIESDEYIQLNPAKPYYAKDGPIDDLSELLMVRGITPQMYFGTVEGMPASNAQRLAQTYNALGPGAASEVGLVDLFTAISGGLININTASAEVLQLIPGMDPGLAQAIVAERANAPFENPGFLASVQGMSREIIAVISPHITTRSVTFLVQVDARVGDYHRHYTALLRRNNRQDVPILYFNWK